MPVVGEPEIVDHSEAHVLPRAANGRDYRITVGVPDSYAANPERRYPILYVTDGYWDYKLLKSIVGGLVYDKAIPEIILVGIGYPGDAPDYGRLRRWDLTPVSDSPEDDANLGESGHAAEFLDVLERQIIPFVEGRYRVDSSFRVLGGSSLGGLFALYVMFTKPALFAAYIAPSPAVPYAAGWLLRHEEAFAKAGKPLAARLYMTVAAEEQPWWVHAVKKFDAQLRAARLSGTEIRVPDHRRRGPLGHQARELQPRRPLRVRAARAGGRRALKRRAPRRQSSTIEVSLRTVSNGITSVRSAFSRRPSPSKSRRTSPRGGFLGISLRRLARANFSELQVMRMTFRSRLFVRGNRIEISRP